MHSIEPYWTTLMPDIYTALSHTDPWCTSLSHAASSHIGAWCTALSYNTDAWCTSMSRGCTTLSHGAQDFVFLLSFFSRASPLTPEPIIFYYRHSVLRILRVVWVSFTQQLFSDCCLPYTCLDRYSIRVHSSPRWFRTPSSHLALRSAVHRWWCNYVCGCKDQSSIMDSQEEARELLERDSAFRGNKQTRECYLCNVGFISLNIPLAGTGAAIVGLKQPFSFSSIWLNATWLIALILPHHTLSTSFFAT